MFSKVPLFSALRFYLDYMFVYHPSFYKAMEGLAEISDSVVLIDFQLNCKCRADVRLRSLCATAPIAFKVKTSSPQKFLVNPPSGLISPLSYATFQIVLRPQTHLPPTFPRSPSDRFLVKTAPVSSNSFDSTNSESVNSWLSTLPDGSTQDFKLKVAFVGPLLLHHAIACGDVDSVKNILRRQKSILGELSQREAESLIRVATELADPENMVNLLLEAGLKIDSRMKTDGVGFYGVDSKWKSKGWNELHVAVAFGRSEEVLNLAKGGLVLLDSRDKEGRTPLHLAVNIGNVDCAKVLLESGADKNAKSKDGRTPLYRAAANGDCPMVKLLIKMGADPTIVDDRGRSAIGIARDKGHAGVLEVLERGDEVLMAARRGDIQLLQSLLHNGSSLDYRDQHGLTALHAAAFKRHKETVDLLAELGANLEWQDNDGHAPLHLAVVGGSLETVKALVHNGANVNAKSKRGATPLYLAKVIGCDEISKFLVDKGAS